MKLVLDDEAAWSGERVPWYYGAAYYDACRALTVYYPMPINWLVRWWMALEYAWLRFRLAAPKWVPYPELSGRLSLEFERGKEVGRAIGCHEGWEAAFKRLEQELERKRARS